MAGFFPVGSQPVASTPEGTGGANYFFGEPAEIIFSTESLPLEISGISPLYSQVMVREMLRSAATGDTLINVHALIREVLRSTELRAGRRRMSLM